MSNGANPHMNELFAGWLHDHVEENSYRGRLSRHVRDTALTPDHPHFPVWSDYEQLSTKDGLHTSTPRYKRVRATEQNKHTPLYINGRLIKVNTL